jgi:SPP1 family phage portal protein
LQPIKEDIDVYDIIKSDWANCDTDFLSAYWVVKNYGGADLKEFQEDLKQKHAVNLGADGEANLHTTEIPYEAKKEFLALATKDIYRDGMGVNMGEITGAVTATEIRAMFYNLAMKATKTERMINRFLENVLFFYGETGELDVTYTRDLVIDELAIINAVKGLKGIISMKTLYEQIPWIDDVDGEIARMDEEQDKMMESISYGNNTEEVKVEDTETTIPKA